MKTRILFLLVLWLLPVPAARPQQPSIHPRSTLFSGGVVIDGTGTKRRRADLRIIDDRITEIGELKPRFGERVIDVRGLVVSPGFVDVHNHSEQGLFKDPEAKSQVLQGIATLAVGPDGGSPFPIADYLTRLERQGTAVNVVAFVGHATVRKLVMGENTNRAATADEIAKMAILIEQGMREGAVGLSTGLEYDTGNPATTEEVIALASVAARHGGIYMSHVRDEADLAFDAFREAIRIGREANVPVQISHIKLGTVGVWNKAGEVVKLINAARREGVDVTADCYPYDAWASTITVLVPSRRHEDPVAVKRGLDDVGGGANVLVTSCAAHRDYEGKTLEEIGKTNGKNASEVYTQIVKDGGAGVVCKSMVEPDVKKFYQQSWVMVASDGGIGSRHPRGAGTFPRVLGRYVRDQKWISLEEAVRKMTLFPARRIGLTDRGVLKVGMKADVVVFDANQIIDRSTMTQPMLEPVGISYLFVNGKAVVNEGKVMGVLAGAVLRHDGTGKKSK